MGYTTEFIGAVTVEPPLNDAEQEYLARFSGTRRMRRRSGPYHAVDDGNFGQSRTDDVIDFNEPPVGQPGLWCQWVPSDGGRSIEWDQSEKFYYADRWMKYLIDHFLKPGAEASRTDDPQFADFTFDHTVNGVIEAQGEEYSDRWRLVVENNRVFTESGYVAYDGAEEVS
jgi:hypothetical protein